MTPSCLDQNLKKHLNDRRLSAFALAKTSGVPRQTIQNWLSGQSPASLTHVKAVADALGLTIEQLCFGSFTDNSAIVNLADVASGEMVMSDNGERFQVIVRRLL